MIRVLIVDDHAIVRQGLRRILEEARGVMVGGEAANGVEALRMIRTDKWDIVLLDISMPERNGIDTLKQIMDGNKETKVLILSMYPEDQYAVRLMKAGASGYLTKETAPEQLVEAIRRVVAGKKYISATLSELLLQECGSASGRPPHEILSDREYQVLRLIGSGKTVSEVAEMLSLSVKTVSTYRAHILEKIRLKNNAELTYYVMQNGLREQCSLKDQVVG
ncbi:MAG: response regulator transcription factor [Nitrosomonadales bacterium]|nr:response regulator transcription factor [Nitrosomonadales bacterium]